MATFTVHQWSHLAAGLRELRRVTRGPIAILTGDPALVHRFWLTDYAPEVLDTEARRYPGMAELAEGLGSDVRVTPVPIPIDCTDGFNEAYYARPHRLLDAGARQACSAWSFVDQAVHERLPQTSAATSTTAPGIVATGTSAHNRPSRAHWCSSSPSETRWPMSSNSS
jgi:hypothetical protein